MSDGTTTASVSSWSAPHFCVDTSVLLLSVDHPSQLRLATDRQAPSVSWRRHFPHLEPLSSTPAMDLRLQECYPCLLSSCRPSPALLEVRDDFFTVRQRMVNLSKYGHSSRAVSTLNLLWPYPVLLLTNTFDIFGIPRLAGNGVFRVFMPHEH